MRVTRRQLRRIIREATIDRSTMPAREFQEHPPWEPIQHSKWPAEEEAEEEQISDDPMLVELEWDSGRNEVITVPKDIEDEFQEEYDRDRWAADSWLTSWLDDEFGEPGDFVSRWRWANTLQDTEIDPELKRWVD